MLDIDALPWSVMLKIVGTFHSAAIACTASRLLYRWYTARFWWEDSWAVFALAVDITCLVAACLEAPTTAQGTLPPIDRTTHWITAVGYPSVIWPCRISILFSIVRVTNPSSKFRCITFFVGGSFIVMWVAAMVQRIRICLRSCMMGDAVGLSQLLMDVASSAALVSLPIWVFRQMKIKPRQRIMLFLVFSAMSLLISAITIFHSVVLFTAQSEGIIFIGHIKAALSLMVCNLLVFVGFIYCVCHKGRADGNEFDMADVVTFTTVDLNTCFTESASTDKQTVMSDDGRGETLDSERFRSTV